MVFGQIGGLFERTVKAGDTYNYYDYDSKFFSMSLPQSNNPTLRKSFVMQVRGSIRLRFKVSRSTSTASPEVYIIQKRNDVEIYKSDISKGFSLNLTYDLNIEIGDVIEIWAKVYNYSAYPASLSELSFKYDV